MKYTLTLHLHLPPYPPNPALFLDGQNFENFDDARRCFRAV